VGGGKLLANACVDGGWEGLSSVDSEQSGGGEKGESPPEEQAGPARPWHRTPMEP
jgi:hypothetical protein